MKKPITLLITKEIAQRENGEFNYVIADIRDGKVYLLYIAEGYEAGRKIFEDQLRKIRGFVDYEPNEFRLSRRHA